MSRAGLYAIDKLKEMPQELVDRIFNDLTIYKLLQLAAWADPTITQYIVEHKYYGKLFSESELTTTVQAFQAYRRVRLICQCPNSEPLFGLNLCSSAFKALNARALLKYMRINENRSYNSVVGHLPGQMLSRYFLPDTHPWSASGTGSCLQDICSAQEAISGIRSSQLLHLASLVETYPQILRQTYDPRGDNSKTPYKHIIKAYKIDARRVFKTNYLRHRRAVHVKYHFRGGMTSVLPRNEYLVLLLRKVRPFPGLEFNMTVQTRPVKVKDQVTIVKAGGQIATGLWNSRPWEVEDPDGNLVEGLSRFEASNSKRHDEKVFEQENTLYPYPEHIQKDLRDVFSGLERRYTLLGHNAREQSPFEGENDDFSQPRITLRQDLLSKALFSLSKAERADSLREIEPSFLVPALKSPSLRKIIQPYHGKELEWLGVFCRAVTYLQVESKNQAYLAEEVSKLQIHDEENVGAKEAVSPV